MRTESRAAYHDRGRVEQLHFVGFTGDNEALMLSSRDDATSGEYFVTIDEYLLAAIEQFYGEEDVVKNDEEEERAPSFALPRRSLPAPARMYPKPSSHLSPREIQARLRSGSSIIDVADEAGVDEEWIIRFAAPILAEQARVVEQAQRLTFTKPRVGPSSQPLRTSVRWNLTDQGALKGDEVFDAGWSAYNLQGPRWVVRLSFVAKRRRKIAEWEVDLREGELLARNRVATNLGYVEPGRRRKHADPELSAPAPEGRADRAGVNKVTRKKKAATKRVPSSRAAARPRKVPSRAVPTKVPAKSGAKSVAKKASGPLAKKASPRRMPGTTVKKAGRKSPAAKVVKAGSARKSATKRAARRATAKRAPSKGPPVPELASERPSPPARALPQLSSSTPGVRPALVGAGRSTSALSGPVAVAPAPVVDTAPAESAAADRRRRVASRVAEPQPPVAVAPVPGPPPDRKPSEHPPLVIMSTPEAHAGAPLSVADTAGEGSRWPKARRRR